MSDLVSRVLEAIAEVEKNAEAATHMRWVFDTNRRHGRTVMQEFFTRNAPEAVLGRCSADRELIALHPQESTDRRWECELCGPEGQNIDCTYPCDTIRLLARGYGISVEEETTGE